MIVRQSDQSLATTVTRGCVSLRSPDRCQAWYVLDAYLEGSLCCASSYRCSPKYVTTPPPPPFTFSQRTLAIGCSMHTANLVPLVFFRLLNSELAQKVEGGSHIVETIIARAALAQMEFDCY